MTNKNRTLGSLFDGIGGFPYAGSFFGITPLWASEILPCAVSVTQRNLPSMAHVGDITKLHGGELPPVDIITFGSPCQGLSYAGKRLGLADERSGLFTEAIRIIREMREATNGKYPRYALWENVPGALSSGTPRGSDFRAVLEAFTETQIPLPRSGKWANAGMVRGHGADLAWCVYNAQYFGVAQRRRRIFLVADFGGGCAGEILFVPKSLRGYFASGGTPRQGVAAYFETGAGDQGGKLTDSCLTPWDVQSRRIHGEDGTWPALYGGEGGGRGYVADQKEPCATPDPHTVCLNDQGGESINVEKSGHSPTLRSECHGNLPVVAQEVYPINTQIATRHKALGKSTGFGIGESGDPAYTLQKSHSHAVAVEQTQGDSPVICRATALANAETLEEKSATLTCYHEQPIICKAVHQNQAGSITTSDTAYSLTTASNASARNAPLVMTEAYGIAATSISRQPHNGGNGLGVKKEVSPTLTATDRHAVGAAVHPEVSGTLCASGAGLSRPAGMASETDLCVAYALQGNMIGRKDENGPAGSGIKEETSFALTATDKHGVTVVFNRQRSDTFGEQDIDSTQVARQYKDATDIVCEVGAVDCRNFRETEEISGTLQAKESGGYSLNSQNPIRTGFIVRRLTPTECERLQGFPDGWTAFDEHGKPISDTKRYQMLGNSVAVPCVAYILLGMAEQLQKEEG